MEHKSDRNRQGQDVDRPNQAANTEPAEGSRENVGGGRSPRQGRQPGAGITNRPLDEEQREQDAVPARGHTKDEERERDPAMPSDDATLKTKI